MLFGAVPSATRAGIVLAGADTAVVQAPPGLEVVAYRNAGYALYRRDDAWIVETILDPISSAAPFSPLPIEPGLSPLDELARRVTSGAEDVYGAVSRVLDWMAQNVRYELDRQLPQDPASVLARRTAHCTGQARLAVAMLAAVGIEAREVPGYIVPGGGEGPAGLHRWVEVHYPDRGWVFSDPQRWHHFVPATYLRLATGSVDTAWVGAEGRLLARDRHLTPVDVHPGADVAARRNDDRQHAAALRLLLPDDVTYRAVLEGEGRRWTTSISDGQAIILGLEPGEYTLRVERPGSQTVYRRFRLAGAVRGSIELPGWTPPEPEGGRSE